jgi:hypothetical protein
MTLWMIDYFEAGATKPGDCYPDFCRSKAEAEIIAPAFMHEPWMDWAERYEIREIEEDDA